MVSGEDRCGVEYLWDPQSLSSHPDAVTETMESIVNESAPRHPNQFLADLTQAMRGAAEAERLDALDRCRADAAAYVERLHGRTETESLQKAAEADVATIRERSKAQVERVRNEAEQRTARRRELLEQELAEYNSAIELEIQSVQDRVDAFVAEIGQFFEKLLQGADPTVFASMASQMPDPPAFAEPDRETLANELRAKREQAEQAERRSAGAVSPAGPASGDKPQALPDHWWMDSPAALAGRSADVARTNPASAKNGAG